jgi:hypothetical protein
MDETYTDFSSETAAGPEDGETGVAVSGESTIMLSICPVQTTISGAISSELFVDSLCESAVVGAAEDLDGRGDSVSSEGDETGETQVAVDDETGCLPRAAGEEDEDDVDEAAATPEVRIERRKSKSLVDPWLVLRRTFPEPLDCCLARDPGEDPIIPGNMPGAGIGYRDRYRVRSRRSMWCDIMDADWNPLSPLCHAKGTPREGICTM